MTAMSTSQSSTSPEATGGAGVAFEFQVDAAFLAFLLAGGTAPLLRGCQLESVHLQSGHLGWRTDDLLLVGKDRSGSVRKAALQAKRHFHFRKSDEESVAALGSAWADFSDSGRFDPARDTTGFVLQSGSSDFFHGYRALLDCARASVDESDFDRRLRMKGYLPKSALRNRDACREMLEEATKGTIPEDRLFQFLRVLDFVYMDFGSSVGAAEASIRTIVQVAADATAGVPQTDAWAELVTVAQAWDGRAQSVTAPQVAKEVGWPTLPRSAPFQKELESLRSTTNVVLRRVTSSIQGVEVRRAEAEAALLGAVNSGGFVIVSGEPGVGKSALAGRVFESVRQDGIALAFRPGMLASGGHINQVLLPYGQTAARLLSTGALYPRNVVLIESAERFLETADAERDAFRDLLATLGEDPSWVIVITCRSFAVETFRSAFLEDTARAVSVLQVPEFSDRDLDVVSAAIPALTAPLSEPRLRRLLRNPFYLGMAARMTWTAPFPTDARGFRQRVWSQVVRHDTYQEGGMPTRRANAFLEVVRRRARSLEAYVLCDDLDPAVIQELRRDMLVAASPENPDALAPADDVLEDWALQHWIENEFTLAARNPTSFFGRIGTHPAIRRAFRVWLSEWLDIAFDEATVWALGVIRGAGYPKHWVDDTITASILSGAGGRFVQRIASEEGFRPSDLLHQLLHLTRVACRRLPSATREPQLVGTRILLPEGGAWEELLAWLDRIPTGDLPTSAIPLYLNFLEDWRLGVSPRSPYPSGSVAAARMALRLAERASTLSYSDRDQAEERALRVALSVPKSVAGDLQTLVDAAVAPDAARGDSIVLKLVLGIVSGAAAARDLPQLAVACVEHVFGMSPAAQAEAKKPDWHDHDMHAVETAFGLPPSGRELGFPPSGFHGPFHHLLVHHTAVAVDLIVRITNHACGAYGVADVRLLEPPGRISFSLLDGRVAQQWINGRLWGLYRSATVGPYPLQCALMALENWLLERAETEDPTLEAALLDLLAQSNNVAITAVVLSVAQTWPQKTWRAILPLLGHRVFFDLDRSRWIADHSAGRIFEDVPFRTAAEDELYALERKKSNAREHRKQSLEQTVVRLQVTEARDPIWKLIDELRAALPPEGERTDDDRLWELVLHRIDLRVFVPAGPAEDGRVLIQPSPPPAEVARMLEASRPLMESRTRRLSLLMWATTVFERRSTAGYDPNAWREKLGEALHFERDGVTEEEEGPDPTASAPAFVAAVCVRDHWDEMSDAERDWCVHAVCSGVEATTDDEFSLGGESVHALDGWMASANVLPSLIPKMSGAPVEARLLHALACAVLHAKAGYVETTMAGIGRDLLVSDRELALSCVKARVAYSRLLAEKGRGWAVQDDAGKQQARVELRGIIERRESWDEPKVLATLNYTKWPWWGLVSELLTLFSWQPTDVLGRAFFQRLAELLASSWTAEARSFRSRASDDDDVGRFEASTRHDVSRSLASIVLEQRPDVALVLTEPIRAAMKQAGREVADFVRDLISAQDRRAPCEAFIVLWRSFAAKYEEMASSHGSMRDELLRCLFFNISWNPGVSEWAPLKGYEREVCALFTRLEASEELIEAFAGFLRTVGAALVPDALPDLASKLLGGAPRVRLTERAIQRLEPILSRLIYGGSIPIRRVERLRNGVLTLLDAMIDGGSSAAYRMRDDFLTPLVARA